MEQDYIKGRGAQKNTRNPFLKQEVVQEHYEGIDESLEVPHKQIFYETPKTILNKQNSPDLAMEYTANPYQGCEHGCIYCYARNSHQYWGFSAGLDFETKLIVKKNAPELLEKHFLSKSWAGTPISIAGNTDCYQPIEKDLKLTRSMLSICLKYGNPLSLITKNSLILRDTDILKDLAAEGLVHVYVSITTLDEKLRLKMEPRTATATNRLKVIETLSKNNIPVAMLSAPIIPGINNQEIPAMLKAAANAGAYDAYYTIVRLNGSIKDIFHDWLLKNFPDRATKVWNQISQLHGGEVNDSQWGRRMKGEGPIAENIRILYKVSKARVFQNKGMPGYNLNAFRKGGNLKLF
jgi:DNA repair photolyase